MEVFFRCWTCHSVCHNRNSFVRHIRSKKHKNSEKYHIFHHRLVLTMHIVSNWKSDNPDIYEFHDKKDIKNILKEIKSKINI